MSTKENNSGKAAPQHKASTSHPDVSGSESPCAGPLALPVLLEWQFTYDNALDQRSLHERDREIGRALSATTKSKYTQLVSWISRLSSQQNKDAARKLDSIEKLLSLALTVSGLIIGALISAAVFHYDGSNPINIITVLLLCVAFPLGTTMLSLLVLVPNTLIRWVPGGRSLQHLLQGISAARVRDMLVWLIPQSQRKNFDFYSALMKRHSSLYGTMRNWKLIHSAQVFTASVLLGLLVHFTFLIVSSDLAFGWSTTLGIESNQLHRATKKISLPWSTLYPEAVPSEGLINESRFFRFKDGTFGTSETDTVTHPDALGAWWPFLILSIVTYGIAPRLVLLFLSAFFFRRSARVAVTRHPRSENVLWRMSTPLISTQSTEQEQIETAPDAETKYQVEGLILTERCIIIDWSQVCGDSLALKNYLNSLSPTSEIDILTAGGNASLEDDQAVIDKIATSESAWRIILAVKSWEPPTEDIIDFVQQLRTVIGQHRLLFILPLACNEESACSRAEDARMEIWLERFSKLADPWTQIVTAPRSMQ